MVNSLKFNHSYTYDSYVFFFLIGIIHSVKKIKPRCSSCFPSETPASVTSIINTGGCIDAGGANNCHMGQIDLGIIHITIALLTINHYCENHCIWGCRAQFLK